MAEAVGTAAAVLQLAGTINDIWQFYQKFENAPKEIRGLRDNLKALTDILRQIEVAFPTTSTTISTLDPSLKTLLDKTLKDMRKEMADFSAKMPLNDKSKGLKERMRWVLKNKAIAEDIGTKIESHKVTLTIVLQMLGMHNNKHQMNGIFVCMETQTTQQVAHGQTFEKVMTELQHLNLNLENIFGSEAQDTTKNSKLFNTTVSSAVKTPRKFSIDYESDHGYTLEDAECFALEGSMGRIDTVVSHYSKSSRDDYKEAVNTIVKIIPRQDVFNFGKGMMLQYQEVRNGTRLPNPRPILTPIAVLPDEAKIFWAVLEGDLEMVKCLIETKQASIYDQRESGLGLLHLAVGPGRSDIVKYLLSEGADPEMRDISFRTPLDVLHEYAPRGLCRYAPTAGQREFKVSITGYEDCVRALEKTGSTSSEDCFDLLGEGAIGWWMQADGIPIEREGEFDFVPRWGEFLRHRGVDIDSFFDVDYNALIASVRNEAADAVPRTALLLELGASLTVTDDCGMTAWHHAFYDMSHLAYSRHRWRYQHDAVRKRIGEKCTIMLKSMKKRGQNILSLRDNFGCTAWDYAVANELEDFYNTALRNVGLLGNAIDLEDEPGEWLAWFEEENAQSQPPKVMPATASMLDPFKIPYTSTSTSLLSPSSSNIPQSTTTTLTPQRRRKIEARRQQQHLSDTKGEYYGKIKIGPKYYDPAIKITWPIVEITLKWMAQTILARLEVAGFIFAFLGMLLMLAGTYLWSAVTKGAREVGTGATWCWVQASMWYMSTVKNEKIAY